MVREHDRASDAGTSHSPAAPQGGAVGKRTLSEQLLALGGDAHASGSRSAHEVASAGVAGAASEFPHRGTIEHLFGRPVPATAHNDAAAVSATQELGANAYAYGSAVAFQSPSPGLRVAAHEAAHVVQQQAGIQLDGGVGAPGDVHEQQADAVAERVVAGRSAADLLGPAGGGSAGAPAAIQRDAAPGADAGASAPAAAASDEWVSSAPDPDPPGEQKFFENSVTKQQLLDAITQVAPGLSKDFRVMLVGHAWVEQQGKHVINNNFAGMEGSSASYVTARTSTVVTRDECLANRAKYSDYGAGKLYNGKDAGTIQAQLDRGEPQIVVMVKTHRPAYASLASAAASFVHNIEAKFRKLQASDKPEHQALAQQAQGGDAEAYAKVVTMAVPKLGIRPYNPAKDYPGRVVAQIQAARADLAGPSPDAGAAP
ncbi:MAG TPA: DUF4157 domain-containing protein [Kofleriaceae bacterium]|nr:DUF4157 domain-containing protein [Kofleriaceae bacterium]